MKEADARDALVRAVTVDPTAAATSFASKGSMVAVWHQRVGALTRGADS